VLRQPCSHVLLHHVALTVMAALNRAVVIEFVL